MAKLVGSEFAYKEFEFFGLRCKVPWWIVSKLLLKDKKSSILVSTYFSGGFYDPTAEQMIYSARLSFTLKDNNLDEVRADLSSFAKKYSKYQPFKTLSSRELGDFMTTTKKSAEALHTQLVTRLLKKY